MKSFLLIGQSNMAGRGNIGEVPEIVNPLCFMLRNGRWQPMTEPINPDRAIFSGRFRSGVGLGASFADEIANATGEQIGLIPCADGGTRIEEWQPGELLFDNAVNCTKLAMRTSELCGILWHQGENDCNPQRIPYYHDRFITMITALKRELGVGDIPVMIGELGRFACDENIDKDAPYARQMNIILAGLADETPNAALVSSEGLTQKEDNIHFNSASYRVFGKRYAEAYFSLVK